MRKRILPTLAVTALLLTAAGPAQALNLSFLSNYLSVGGLLERFFSPGTLNEQHQDTSCISCHRPFKGLSQDGCASGNCHPPAKLKEAKPAAAAIHERNAGQRCTTCHTEHKGRQAPLTLSFHQSAGPAQQKDCAACHGAEAGKAHPEIRAQGCLTCHTSTSDWKAVSVDHGGLADTPCADCHAAQAKKAHPAIAEQQCEACHSSTADWKKVQVDHARLADTSCADCHAAQAKKAHPAIAGQQCTACHRSTADWKKVQVDHARLADRTCTDCHAAQAKKAHPAIAGQQCTACHRSTADWKKVSVDHRAVGGQSCATCHQGRKPRDGLHTALGGTSCGNCHKTTAWKPARFSHGALPAAAAQRCADCHGGLAQRAHPAIKSTNCAACHTPSAGWGAAKVNHAQVSRDACAGCHTPPNTSIHSLAKGSSCATCHTTGAWKPTSFRHPRIPEYGEHMQQGCRACHPTTLTQAVSCDYCHGRGGFEDD